MAYHLPLVDYAMGEMELPDDWRIDYDDLRSAGVEGLANAWKARDGIEGAFSSYAIPAIQREVVREIKRHRGLPRNGGAMLGEFDVVDGDGAPDPPKSLIAREAAALVDDLPPDERDVIKCRFWRGMTQAETAATLGKCRQRVTQIEAAALANLKDAIGGE